MLGKLFSGEAFDASTTLPPTFTLTGQPALRLSNDYQPLSLWRFLSHHVRRYPLDLRAHVQRILLAAEPDLHDRLEGSLMDLYLALGDSGSMLKTRMLKTCSPLLTDESQNTFSRWLQENSAEEIDQQWRIGSVLASGSGHNAGELVTMQRSESASSYASIMDEVQACMEYGQVEVAQDLLEQEVFAGRTDEQIEQELLNIYQYTRDKAKLNQMAEAMAATGFEPSPQWQEAQREAGNW